MSEWISIEERLPEQSGEILCYADGQIFNAYYDDAIDDDFQIGRWNQYFNPDTLGWEGDYWEAYDAVTHWMPLPEAPKEG